MKVSDKVDYHLEPVSENEIEITDLETPNKVIINPLISTSNDTEFITLKIPKSIITKDGKILKPKYIQYSDAYLYKNEQNPIKLSQKFFPTELQLL